ncbi:MAG TPA: hypothetical protein VEL70_08775 [Candidatus Acidoferrum sp.]|nr:hypothetical protein [Candidatus Acidoferrum sp.]
MQGWHDTTQLILNILSNPVLGGLGSICSLIAIPLSVFLARRSPTHHPQLPHHPAKKITKHVRSFSLSGTRSVLRDGYHRAFLAKDLDSINPTNLNRHLLPILKKIG